LDDWRLVDMELDASEWRKAPMQKVVGTVENARRTDGPAERKDGGRWRWSVVEREDGGRSDVVESAVSVWSRWSTRAVESVTC
jgi:hypothetical protein